jgi:hypothetical protein
VQKIEASEYRTIAELRRNGASLRSIGDRYGVSRERIRQIVHDHYPSVTQQVSEGREQARRERVICPDCGGVKAPTAKKCRACKIANDTRWTRERIISAMQEYHRLHGTTPSCTAWNPSLARWRNSPELADKFYSDGCWPSVQTVQIRFGSWNAAVDAAGLTRNRAGRRPKQKPTAPQSPAL